MEEEEEQVAPLTLKSTLDPCFLSKASANPELFVPQKDERTEEPPGCFESHEEISQIWALYMTVHEEEETGVGVSVAEEEEVERVEITLTGMEGTSVVAVVEVTSDR